MDTTQKSQWYAIIIASLASLFICLFVFKRTLEYIQDHLAFYLRKHLLYRRFHIYRRASTTTSWFQSMLVLTYITGNVLCLFLKLKSRDDLIQQTALLSTINLIPLCIGSHPNLVADYCGLGLESMNCMHRWIGRVVFLEGLLHTLLAVTSKGLALKSSAEISGVVVGTAYKRLVLQFQLILR
jgi:hypothetical protein